MDNGSPAVPPRPHPPTYRGESLPNSCGCAGGVQIAHGQADCSPRGVRSYEALRKTWSTVLSRTCPDAATKSAFSAMNASRTPGSA